MQEEKKHSEHQNFTGNKRTRSFQKESDNNGTSSSSSDDEFTPKYKKSYGVNINANFIVIMDRRCEELIVADNFLFKNRKTFPKFVLAPLRGFLNLKLDRLSLLKLECEMNSTGYPDDHKLFELGYCGHTHYPHSKIFLDQSRALILSQLQEEEHPFIINALGDKIIHLVAFYYVYKPKTDTPKTKNTEDDENAYKFGPKYGGESTGFHQYMISVVVFSYSETLKSMLIKYTAT